ncbi:sulfotransferase [uncultured Vibrio sp.]|uniref:sulfotransferase n=1 Tax=uncultured Vibrio sp. TaxID=114054 RepID=UPI002AA88317|nr:sulfotransferase [uncultured Vibrio sp.]
MLKMAKGDFESAMVEKIDFFIVGAPKCGTTALVKYLGKHSNVFFPPFINRNVGKIEPNHFATDLLAPTNPFGRRDYFLSFYSDAPKDSLLGDASVDHLYSKVAARNIHLYNPKAKIIIMLRNPADFLFSYYNEMRWGLAETKGTIEAALRSDHCSGERSYKLDYIGYASFAGQVERYLQVFPRDQVLILKFDDFVSRTDHVYDEVLNFLGLPKFPIDMFERVNPSKLVRFRALRKLVKKPPRVIVKVVRVLAPHTQLRNILRRYANLIETKLNYKVGKLKYSEKTRKELLVRFAPEVLRLAEVTGLDLADWQC